MTVPTPKKLTPLQAHIARWADGCGSEYCEGAGRCFARGDVPCDVLFIGEAPGKTENILCSPFTGPAGQLLDAIVAEALDGAEAGHDPDGPLGGLSPRKIRVCFCNLVMCMPMDDGEKAAPPSRDQVLSCAPRLAEFIAIADPRLMVLVGGEARDWLDQKASPKVALPKRYDGRSPGSALHVDIQHPAYLLRLNHAQRGILQQRCVMAVQNGLYDSGILEE